VERDIQVEVLERLARVRFGRDGYLFGSTLAGEPLFTNGKVTRGGPSVWDLTDPNGVKIIQEQSLVARHSQGGFMEYSWVKLDGHEPSPKVAFVLSIPEWGWQIGSGFYADDIEGEIEKRTMARNKDIARDAYRLAGLLLVLVGLSLLIAALIAPVQNHLLVFGICQEQGQSTSRVDDIPYWNGRSSATGASDQPPADLRAPQRRGQEAGRGSRPLFHPVPRPCLA
jgi:signal transduction histidine kinase